MQALATAVFPVFLLILLGLLLRQRGWLADGIWEPAEQLCYFVLLPALLLTSLAQADFAALAAAAVTGAGVLAIMALTRSVERSVCTGGVSPGRSRGSRHD